ncbi:MAG: NAD-dependent epimerase/dehydratase family protein, partial [Gemmatimonadales bacterium]
MAQLLHFAVVSPPHQGRPMRILVTGHQGYIGSVLTPLLRNAGHEVTG